MSVPKWLDGILFIAAGAAALSFFFHPPVGAHDPAPVPPGPRQGAVTPPRGIPEPREKTAAPVAPASAPITVPRPPPIPVARRGAPAERLFAEHPRLADAYLAAQSANMRIELMRIIPPDHPLSEIMAALQPVLDARERVWVESKLLELGGAAPDDLAAAKRADAEAEQVLKNTALSVLGKESYNQWQHLRDNSSQNRAVENLVAVSYSSGMPMTVAQAHSLRGMLMDGPPPRSTEEAQAQLDGFRQQSRLFLSPEQADLFEIYADQRTLNLARASAASPTGK